MEVWVCMCLQKIKTKEELVTTPIYSSACLLRESMLFLFNPIIEDKTESFAICVLVIPIMANDEALSLVNIFT